MVSLVTRCAGFFLLLAPVGCATLDKTQVESIHQYATLTSGYTAYPGKILDQFLEMRYESRLLLASQLAAPGEPLTFQQLTDLYADKRREQAAVASLDEGIRAIDAYAQALKKLSSPDFVRETGTAAGTLGASVDSLVTRYNALATPRVPLIGTLVGKVLGEAGGRYVGRRQTQALKTYVQQGDTLVATLTRSLEQTLDDHVTVYLSELRKDAGTTQNRLLRKLPDSAGYERYRAAVEAFAILERLDALERTNQRAIAAIRRLRTAHHELKVSALKKQKLLQTGKELVGLYRAVDDLKTAYQEINP